MDKSKYVPLSCTGAAAGIHWQCAEGNCMSLVQCSTHDVHQIQTVNLNRKLVLTLNTSSRHGSYMHARTNTKICRGIGCRIDAPWCGVCHNGVQCDNVCPKWWCRRSQRRRGVVEYEKQGVATCSTRWAKFTGLHQNSQSWRIHCAWSTLTTNSTSVETRIIPTSMDMLRTVR